ncbi:MAG: 2-C-methyl-D-erythritol 2,4-cyclodiphosphate synthase, partial [Eubacteriales bacterium]|nr:2-C-methyl-D-erythritol 2,4-cyclodiphosphate synthase [Eubacteriales bacterium]
VLTRVVEAFAQNASTDEIYVVVHQDYVEISGKEYRNGKIKQIISGGAERQDSVYAALSVLPADVDFVLVHDGARPFVTNESIDALIESAVKHRAAIMAVPVKDTIKAAEEGIFTETLDRSRLYSIQTPQGFDRKLLIAAYEKAFAEKFYGTDDAVLVEKMGEKVYLVKGDYNNIKITTKEDFKMGEAIAAAQSGRTIPVGQSLPAEELRTGTGFDVHRLVEGRKLILGGVELPFEKGLLGHSDADVLLHAIMDALLGAAALGDIGRHFSDKDESYRNISSLLLLKRVKELLDQDGWQIGNIDATVIAQRPKIAPYIQEMNRGISEVLGVEEDRINIKGTTTETLGFCGREEGIASQASVLIRRLL